MSMSTGRSCHCAASPDASQLVLARSVSAFPRSRRQLLEPPEDLSATGVVESTGAPRVIGAVRRLWGSDATPHGYKTTTRAGSGPSVGQARRQRAVPEIGVLHGKPHRAAHLVSEVVEVSRAGRRADRLRSGHGG